MFKRLFVISSVLVGVSLLAGCAGGGAAEVNGGDGVGGQSETESVGNPYYVDDPADQPQASKEYYALSREERRERARKHWNDIATCMQEKGYDAWVDISNSLTIRTKGSSEAALRQQKKDEKSCAERFPSVFDNLKMTRANYEEHYDYLVSVNACIEAHGYQTIPPPSKELWVDQAVAGAPEWHPYHVFYHPDQALYPNISASEENKLLKECPQE